MRVKITLIDMRCADSNTTVYHISLTNKEKQGVSGDTKGFVDLAPHVTPIWLLTTSGLIVNIFDIYHFNF